MTEEVVTEQADAVEINRIMAMIPHRYPMLLIDRVVDMKVPSASRMSPLTNRSFRGIFRNGR
jgi:3-hydroxymyristoyl/3-hydroxydecanoyl-(acyl carrier protein) dehydratase